MKLDKLSIKIATGVSLLLIGTLVLFSNYIKEKREVVFSDMNLALSQLQEELEREEAETESQIDDRDFEIEIESEIEEEQEEKKEQSYEKYLGTISIPKIGLYRGFYSKDSILNKVDKNLYVLPQSDYPDVSNGNLIIAGHSGTRNVAFFKNLYKLEISDEVTINYNDKNYIYKVEKKYEVEKNGSVKVLRNASKTTLTLITCTNGDNYHQTVYIAYLDRVE